MVKLTEDMVVARSKGSELHNIKKLNCWGSELTNVSVIKKLTNVEVLSLSVNQISSLEDFQYCSNLQELYIRKNNISNINEVLYLRQIPKLKSLWLADNPCADFAEYRLTVLRALPHLQKLDNVAVEPEEVQQAMVCGLQLPLPNSDFRGQEVPQMPRSSSMGESLKSESGGGNSSLDSSPSSSHPHHAGRQSLEEGYEYTQNVYDEDEEQPQMRRSSMPSQSVPEADIYEKKNSTFSSQSSPRRSSHGNTTTYDPEIPLEGHPFPHSAEYNYDTHNANYVNRDEHYPRYTDLVSPSTVTNCTTTSSPTSPHLALENINNCKNNHFKNSAVVRRSSREQYRDHYWPGESDGPSREQRGLSRSDEGYTRPPRDSYASRPPQDFRSPQGEMRHFTHRPSSVGEVIQQHYDQTYRRVDQQIDAMSRCASSVDRPSPSRPYPLRPKTRNANVLSAVLCLIKELDYSSLEVAEMAIRCRMEELDD